jgi:hypothetical protein
LDLDAFHSPFDNLLKSWKKTAFHHPAAMDSLSENRKNLLSGSSLTGSASPAARLEPLSCAILVLASS